MNMKAKSVNLSNNLCSKNKNLSIISLIFIIILFSSCFVSALRFGVSPFVLGTPDKIVSNEFELKTAINDAQAGQTVIVALNNDITLFTGSLVIPVNKNIVLTSVGEGVFWKLIGGNNYETILVNGILTLDGIVVTHAKGANGQGVVVNVNGMLTLSSGSISGNMDANNMMLGGVFNWGTFVMFGGDISNNTFAAGGGVYNFGTFAMYNGVIANNTASTGGGVSNSRDGSFTMFGGVIANNTSTNYGGGVHNSGTFELRDGSVITNNTAHTSGGGVQNAGNFIMVCGKVSNNTATNGGGVHNGETFLMFDGILSGNTVMHDGGGVYNYGIFVMSGGAISNNVAGVYGGGVRNDGVFEMSDSVVFNNTAAYGGGVRNNNGALFSLLNSSISNNVATFMGGGVYNYNSSFMMYNGTISHNMADDSGGVANFAAEAIFNLFGGEISNNTATYRGGGVGIYHGTFEMWGGKISSNSAVYQDMNNNTGYSYHGGGGVYNMGTFTMAGGEISNNNADYGGGVCVDYDIFVMSDGIIANNTATFDGGGVYMAKGVNRITGGVISGNVALYNGGGIGVYNFENLGHVYIAHGVVFEDNSASVAYNRNPDDDALYAENIKCTVWTAPLTQGYNNYDISYTRGTPIAFTVSVTDSYASTTGAGNYASNTTVTIDAGSRNGYSFSKWSVTTGNITLSNVNDDTTTFTMPDHNVAVTAIWTPIRPPR